jgi:hypothetical protein
MITLALIGNRLGNLPEPTLLARLRRSVIAPLLLATTATFVAAPVLADTLVGNGIRLEQGVLRAASDPVLSSASGTLRIEGAVVGQFAAGISTGASGTTLRGGLLPIPIPEPSTGLLLTAGASALIAVGRRRAVRFPHAAQSAHQGLPS